MPDVDWEKVAESLDEFVALRKKELTAVDVTVPSRPAVVVGWRAEALAEIIAAARWGLEAQQRGRGLDTRGLDAAYAVAKRRLGTRRSETVREIIHAYLDAGEAPDA